MTPSELLPLIITAPTLMYLAATYLGHVLRRRDEELRAWGEDKQLEHGENF